MPIWLRAQPPAELARQHQQRDVDQAQQHHRVRNIVFEQTDHVLRAALYAVRAGQS